MSQLNIKTPRASVALESYLSAVEEYEERFLGGAPQVAETYRYIGLYRLFGKPSVYSPVNSWLTQLVLETEIARDKAVIETSEQLDIYVDNFMTRMAAVNNGFEENGDIQRIIQLGFNNLYDAWGFNDE